MEIGDLEKELEFYGLSKKESKIYVYLLANGAKEVSEVSHGLAINKADIYKYLKELEGKGICQEVLTHPSKFEASSLEEALNLLILKQGEIIEYLKRTKDEVASSFGKIVPPTTEPKFQILQGREPTTNKIRRIRRSSNDVMIYVRERTLTFLHTLGLLDVAHISEGLSIRILSRLTPKTMEFVDEYKHCRFRNVRDEADLNLPEFAVFDKKETLVALSASNRSALIDKDELAMWTDSEAPAMMVVALFEKMWASAEDPRKTS